MGRGVLLAVVAAVGLAALIFWESMNNNDQETAAALPGDPAGRRTALRQACANEGVTGPQQEILVGQAQLETGNFKSAEFPLCLSAWNRHVGSGKHGDWNGKVCMLNAAGSWQIYENDQAALADDPTNAREHLRCFDSLEQCVRDMVNGLLQLSLYADARAAYLAGDAAGYAAAIVHGDGTQGFVGPIGTTKASNYTAGLIGQFQELGVA